jgi:hypothetical protein
MPFAVEGTPGRRKTQRTAQTVIVSAEIAGVPEKPQVRMGKGRRLLNRSRVFWYGLYFRHPVCCTVRFTFSPGGPGYRHELRGGKWTEKAGEFVPCGVFHHHDPDYPPAPVHGFICEASPFSQACANGAGTIRAATTSAALHVCLAGTCARSAHPN